MLFLIVENVRDGDARPVYRRFRDRGRLAPDALTYIASWVTEDFRRRYQVMECDDRALAVDPARMSRIAEALGVLGASTDVGDSAPVPYGDPAQPALA